MSKHIDLAKKLKALSEKGIEGEKINAGKILNDLLKKYHLTIEDIEGEKTQNYFFEIKPDDAALFNQIVKRVNYDLKVYGEIPEEKIKEFNLKGNFCTDCTASEFIEIKTMFEHYSDLYKRESEIFFGAFCSANDLLIKPPKSQAKTINDLTSDELEIWTRQQLMASRIKTETFRRRLENKV